MTTGKKRNAKGEGSFKINPDGTITHRKHVGYKLNGARKILTVTANTKTACIKEMRTKENEWKKEQEKITFSDALTVEELCTMHLRYQMEHNELKPKSIDRKECTIENHIGEYDLGKMQIHAVKSKDIDAHIKGLINEGKLSYSSIEKVLDVLNAAFAWAKMMEKWDTNPVEKIKPSLVKKISKMQNKSSEEADVIVLSDEECELFEAEALKLDEKTGDFKYTAGVYGVLLLHTGMRCGEMIALRWKDVDFENGLLKIEKSQSMAKNREWEEGENKYIPIEGTTKNEKAREIRLTKEALDALRLIRVMNSNIAENDFVCVTKTGKTNTATNLGHRMAVIFKNAGLSEYTGSLHIFRRTFATKMYEDGARVEDIAAYIGDLVSTTEKYYIAIRKKVKLGEKTKHIVEIPKKQMTDNKAG